ncbi:MAG: hypothetical protein NTY75_03295 [Candidatus Shapirobacteria bacterium]|nr:hypothetical protein [Candidatus Shapirobacteria bacterium]
MKIYFVASPRLVIKEPELYRGIHRYLAKNNVMLSDKLIKWTDKKSIEDVYNESAEKLTSGYKRAIEAVKKADVIMMEVSGHSVSMGFLASKSLDLSKPVVAFYKKGTRPFFLSGINDPRFKLIEYNNKNINEMLDLAVEEVKKSIDIRFNFFVSPKILAYLDWVSQKKMTPRSVFLRDLIEKEMKKDKEFKA